MLSQNNNVKQIGRKPQLHGGLLLFGLLLMVSLPMAAQADLWQYTPSYSLSTGYDDNARLTVSNQDKVYVGQLAAALTVSSLTEIRDVRGYFRAVSNIYSGDNTDLPNTNNFLAGMAYDKKNPRGSWGVEGSMRQDTIVKPVYAIVDPGNITIEPDNNVDYGIVQLAVRRTRYVFKPTWDHSLSELTGIRLGYRFDKVDYNQVTGTGLEEFEDHTVRAELYRHISETDVLAGALVHMKYDAPAVNRNYNTDMLQGILRHKFSETSRGHMTLGLYHTSWKTPTQNGDETGYDLSLFATKTTGLTQYSADVLHTLYPTGAGDVVQTDELIGNITHKLSPRSRFTLRSRLFQNKSLRLDNPDANRRYLDVRSTFRWQMTPDWFLDVTYDYSRQKRDTDPTSASENVMLFTFVYTRTSTLE